MSLLYATARDITVQNTNGVTYVKMHEYNQYKISVNILQLAALLSSPLSVSYGNDIAVFFNLTYWSYTNKGDKNRI